MEIGPESKRWWRQPATRPTCHNSVPTYIYIVYKIIFFLIYQWEIGRWGDADAEVVNDARRSSRRRDIRLSE